MILVYLEFSFSEILRERGCFVGDLDGLWEILKYLVRNFLIGRKMVMSFALFE